MCSSTTTRMSWPRRARGRQGAARAATRRSFSRIAGRSVKRMDADARATGRAPEPRERPRGAPSSTPPPSRRAWRPVYDPRGDAPSILDAQRRSLLHPDSARARRSRPPRRTGTAPHAFDFRIHCGAFGFSRARLLLQSDADSPGLALGRSMTPTTASRSTSSPTSGTRSVLGYEWQFARNWGIRRQGDLVARRRPDRHDPADRHRLRPLQPDRELQGLCPHPASARIRRFLRRLEQRSGPPGGSGDARAGQRGARQFSPTTTAAIALFSCRSAGG